MPRVYDMVLEIISHSDGRVDSKSLCRFIASYQSEKTLTLGELWAIPIMLRLAVIENLRRVRSEEHTSELQSRPHLVCRLLLEKIRPPPTPTLFPYTTLFRSHATGVRHGTGNHFSQRRSGRFQEPVPLYCLLPIGKNANPRRTLGDSHYAATGRD